VRFICLASAMLLMLPYAVASSHVSRDAAVQLLRHEGILSGKTKVISASWEESSREWLITLRHPSGTLSAWFIDAAGQSYHGGPCKH
ncbi:MAG: hypothetical protein WBX14_02475, partial [Candidatus Udaeobacter sp.]